MTARFKLVLLNDEKRRGLPNPSERGEVKVTDLARAKSESAGTGKWTWRVDS